MLRLHREDRYKVCAGRSCNGYTSLKMSSSIPSQTDKKYYWAIRSESGTGGDRFGGRIAR